MAKTTYYYQCDLARGTLRTHGYIEQKGAVVGRKVKLLDTDEPDVDWEVLSVSDKGITGKRLSELNNLNRDWHRIDI